MQVPAEYSDSSDVSSRLDHVERALRDGAVTHSISLLRSITHNSAAQHLSQEWIRDAQKYASLQEIRKIFLARAQELSLTLSQ